MILNDEIINLKVYFKVEKGLGEYLLKLSEIIEIIYNNNKIDNKWNDKIEAK